MIIRKEVICSGIKISYLEKNQSAKSIIFFIHGNSSSAHMWQKQFESECLASYQLVAFDLPAHGQSETLPIEYYNLPYFAFLISKAIHQICEQKPYIIVGFSFGANILSEMLACAVKPNGMGLISPVIIGGIITLQDTGKEDADPSPLFNDGVSKDAIENCIKLSSLSSEENDFKGLMDGYNSVKPSFRPALFQSIIDGKLNDEIALLKSYNIPSLIIFGDDEKMINQHYLDHAELPLWNHTIYRLPGGSHFINIDQPQKVNDLLHQYIRSMLIDNHT
jgi:pimeloyl-ACP methyl ester carboxylesterase